MVRLSKKIDQRQQRLPLALVPQAPKKWQTYQQKQKRKRWLKTVSLALGAVFALGLIISVFRLGWWLGQPLEQAQFTQLAPPKWGGREQLNLLLVLDEQRAENEGGALSSFSTEFLLASLSPGEGTLKILTFPDDLKIPTTSGDYTLFELLRLASVQNPPLGVDFVIKRLSSYLAVPIDGYVATTLAGSGFGVQKSKLRELVLDYHHKLQSPLLLLRVPSLTGFVKNKVASNLSPGQAFKLLWKVRGVRFDRLQFYELPLGLSEGGRDAFVQDIFADPAIVKERLKISVQNAGNVPGLARQTARVFENIGGEVVEVQNSKFKIQQPRITVYSAPKRSITVRRLEDILGITAQWVRVEEVKRADIAVMVTG